jgi:oxaloacetate decarboxylase alpha subunit
LDIKVMETDPRTLENQIPGGMYSNLISQMKAQNIFHRFNEVLEEIPKVRKDMGYPPLVTPISQMVGAQATANVLNGKRYQTVMKEIKGYFRGEYGRPPGEVNEEFMQQLVGTTKFPSSRISESLPAVYEKTKEKYKNQNYGKSDILTLILFPELADAFIEKRNHKDEFFYTYRCERAVNISASKKIERAVSDAVKAVIIAILAKTLNLPEKAIKIETIYELDGG